MSFAAKPTASKSTDSATCTVPHMASYHLLDWANCAVLLDASASDSMPARPRARVPTGNSCCVPAGTITTADLERYKQKLARGALTAGLNYYRAAIDSVTWNKPKPRCRSLSLCCDLTGFNGVGTHCPAGSISVRTAVLQHSEGFPCWLVWASVCAACHAAAPAPAPIYIHRHVVARSRLLFGKRGHLVCREQHRVDCPCLVLWADSDTKMGVQLLNGIEEVVARPEVHVLDNSSHWLQQDK